MIEIEDPDLDNIISLRAQFEKQNQSYSAPVTPNENLLRFLKKDEVELSDEAMYWARLVRDASTIFDANMTFQDTVIADRCFYRSYSKGNSFRKIFPSTMKMHGKIKSISRNLLFRTPYLKKRCSDSSSARKHKEI